MKSIERRISEAGVDSTYRVIRIYLDGQRVHTEDIETPVPLSEEEANAIAVETSKRDDCLIASVRLHFKSGSSNALESYKDGLRISSRHHRLTIYPYRAQWREPFWLDDLDDEPYQIIPISERMTLRESTFRTPTRPQTIDHIPTYVRSPKPKGYRNDKVVYAREDISVANNVYILKGTPGRIETCGAWALNVKFEGHQHAMLCTYDMVSEVKPRELKKLHNSPFKTGQVVTITTQKNIVGVVDNIRFDGVHFIQTQDTERFKYGVCTALEWELKTVAIIPVSERRTLIDVCWNAPNPVFVVPPVKVDDRVRILIEPWGEGIVRELHSGHLYLVLTKYGLSNFVRRDISLCLTYDCIKILGYCPEQCDKPCLYGKCRNVDLMTPVEEPPQPLTPEKTLTEQPKRPLKKGDRVRVLVGAYAGKIGTVAHPRYYKNDPPRSYCAVDWDDGAPQSAYKFHMLELVEEELIKNQPQIMAENMQPIEPLPINCAECGQRVGLETVVHNKKTYCMDCGEPKLREAQDETLFIQKLSDAPDETTPAPRQIEQPPQPEIPMKQLSLFGDM